MLPEHGETELQFRESSLGCLDWGTEQRQREATNSRNVDIKSGQSGEKMFSSLKRERERDGEAATGMSRVAENNKRNLL